MPAAVAMTLLEVAKDQWASLYADLQNDDGDSEGVINTVCDVAAPVPQNLLDVLLVNANGDDPFTQRMYIVSIWSELHALLFFGLDEPLVLCSDDGEQIS